MGVLEERGEREHTLHTLGVRCLLGRHHACDVCIDDPQVSAEHASLYWIGDQWVLRDLASRNGTWIEGRRLGAGERALLVEGGSFSLGPRGRIFTLSDASPPCVRARHGATGKVRAAENGLLVLPDDERPLVSLFEEAGGAWILETEQTRRGACDREIVHVAGEPWVLELPRAVLATSEEGGANSAPGAFELRLALSRDEEHVEVSVLHAGIETALPPRAAHYLLVILARARLADHEASPAERGWVDRDELCRMLRIDENHLNVTIFRLRKQLAALKIQGIGELVARRPGTGQVRLGTDRVTLRSL
jgi:hypothetical protein